MLILRTVNSFPTYITNPEIDETSNSPNYDDDYYFEDYEKLKAANNEAEQKIEDKQYLKFINYINSYIDSYLENHKHELFYEVGNDDKIDQLDDLTGYQGDDSGVNYLTNDQPNFQKLGNLNENLTSSDNCSECFEKLNATLAELLRNSTSTFISVTDPIQAPEGWPQIAKDTVFRNKNRQEL